MNKNTVVELFAGVGGFRIGLNNVKLENNEVIENNTWEVVFANQWEPSTKTQHAYDCYHTRFGNVKDKVAASFENTDIGKVPSEAIPNHKLLVGGFPCQDYSVARSLKGESGIEGKKGVLWWQINRIINDKKPKFILLENVDRLLKSPSTQRGRDFGIILKSLEDSGYNVEWRVINAGDYKFPQRRRRVFIFAFKKDTTFNNSIKDASSLEFLTTHSIFQKAFPAVLDDEKNRSRTINLNDEFTDIVTLSDEFAFNFENNGVMIDGNIYTHRAIPQPNEYMTLGEILVDTVDNKYFLNDKQKESFAILRGSKKKIRVRPDGTEYTYSEGSMSPYDSSDLPGRTMLTSEGTTNRSTHVVVDNQTKELRFITPIEAERLNMFPDNWTNLDFMTDRKRYFTMGNALVTGIIKELGNIIKDLT